MADGSRHSMFITPETEYGVTPTDPEFTPVRHTGTTLALSKNTNQSDEIRPDRQISDFRHGACQVGGDISVELSYGSFDSLLEAVLMGTWENNVLKVGTKRRSFSVLRNFTDMDESSDSYHLFRGAEINNLNLQISPDSIVSATFSVVGKGMTTAPAAPAGSNYSSATNTKVFDSFTGVLKENGGIVASITQIELTLENGIDPRFVLCSKETILPQSGRSNLSGQITAYFEDSTLLNKFINETESSLELMLKDLDNNVYTFLLPRIKYNGGQPDVSGQGAITLSMPFQALFDETEQSNIVITRS